MPPNCSHIFQITAQTIPLAVAQANIFIYRNIPESLFLKFYIQWFRIGCLTSKSPLCNIWVLQEASLNDNHADKSNTESKMAAQVLE